MRVLLSTYGGRGDVEPLAGLAVRLRAFGPGADVRAVRLAGPARRLVGGRQQDMRTCLTRGSTELEAPVIQLASAMRRSKAASEVWQ